jgi:ElaA protein
VTDTRTAPLIIEPIRWQWGKLAELSSQELYEALALRQRVFVVEQNCAYQDADGSDPAAWHQLGWSAAEPRLLAYARVYGPGIKYAEASIGRVVTAPEVRREGLGRVLMKEAMRRCEAVSPGSPIRLGAQMRLERFYEELGFRTVSEMYVEDGIQHVEMLWP